VAVSTSFFSSLEAGYLKLTTVTVERATVTVTGTQAPLAAAPETTPWAALTAEAVVAGITVMYLVEVDVP
jgi:hypothetical protein